ncbi:unnamed protein product [Meganyctiphanes norvegica]|uniref:SCP domain-containing protein n=1 Tax=Meganyctiphanes norvegica TaxID=48144 RepID=A0AAV2Q3A3_MEGNR
MYSAWSFNSASVWDAAIQSWYDEVKNMPASLVNSFAQHPTGKVISQYTQVVWAETYEVGCGAIHYPDTAAGIVFPEAKIYVCNYGPGGNWLSSPVYLTGPAASNCPDGNSSDYAGLCAPPA